MLVRCAALVLSASAFALAIGCAPPNHNFAQYVVHLAADADVVSAAIDADDAIGYAVREVAFPDASGAVLIDAAEFPAEGYEEAIGNGPCDLGDVEIWDFQAYAGPRFTMEALDADSFQLVLDDPLAIAPIVTVEVECVTPSADPALSWEGATPVDLSLSL